MENNRSFVDEILTCWGIQGIDFDSYVNAYNSKNLIVDIFPFSVLDPEKFWQVEVFYGKLLDKTISPKCYFDYEGKYLRFIKFLWLYNVTDAFFDLNFDNYFRKGIKKHFKPKHPQASEELHNVDSWLELEEFVTLALREAGYIFLHFKDWNLIVMINDFSMLVLCKEEKTTFVIKELAEKTGLFVRLCKNGTV